MIYTATALASKIGRSVKMLADAFADDDHYLNAAANFPNMPPATINDALNSNSLTD